MKARIPIAISEWAARAICKRLKANQGNAGKAEGGSRTLIIPSTRVIQLLEKNLQMSHSKRENVKP